MNRKTVSGLILVALALVAIGGLYLWSQTRVPQEAVVHPTISQDLYPLFSGVSWNQPEVETFTISTSTYSGASVSSSPVMNTMDPGSVFTPFERYYESKLVALGYTEDKYLAAGGHVGGQTGYRKGESLILTRFHITYHTAPSDAPSECPCDVTLSLFSQN